MAGEGTSGIKPGYSLRVKLKRKYEDEDNTKEANVKKMKLKRRESYERWKKQMKNNPYKLAKFKCEDAAKHRQTRRGMSDEKRSIYNAKAGVRMKRYRERKRMSDENETKKKTRNQIQKQREYWKKKKREQRSQMSEERQMIEREKRKRKYLESKIRKKLDFDSAPKPKRINIPQQSQSYADSIRNLVTKCTPRKKRALKERGIGLLSPNTARSHATYAKIVANLKLGLKKLKESQTVREKQLYYVTVRSIVGKHYVEKNMRQALDLKMKYWRKLSYLQEEPIPLVTSVSDETKENIKGFYLADSDYLSSRRNATKKVMTDTLKNAHSTFLSKNQGTKVSLSTFKKRRPKQVLTMDKAKFQGCLCEYCVNIEFKLETLNKHCNQTDFKELKLENKFQCLKMTICPTENEHEIFKDKQCIYRQCKKCGEQNIALHYHPLIEKMGDKVIKWKKWELHSLNDGKKRQMLIEKEGSVLKLVKELTDELIPFSRHIFTAMWQRKQYKNLISNIPQDNVVLLMDFAENYRCVNQDEIQAAYYQYQQATVFPIIAHYRCDECKDGIVQESAVFISPDTKHDSSAAHEFIRVMNEHLRETVNIKHEIQYSDGCAGQFKSKIPFQHMSEASDHTVEKSYLGSRHGKSLCDSLGGLVKNQAAKHVRSRKGTIPDAKALYDFGIKNLTIDSDSKALCLHKKRRFFYIDQIPRKSGSNYDLLTVKGTQTFHNVKGVSPGIIKVRKLACFCNSCVTNDGSRCENIDTVGSWETKQIPRRKKKSLEKSPRKNKSKVTKKKAKSERNKKIKGKGQKVKPEPPSEKKLASKETASKDSNDQILLSCSKFSELLTAVESLDLEPIPICESRTICNSNKAVDTNSLPLVPDDTPMKPASQLMPVIIYGDGNCLPRAASFLAFGHEENHQEIRRRIVIELTKNEKLYLDNETMRKGKHIDGDDNVVKMFAMYSSCYMGRRLNSRSIRSVLEIIKSGQWMGMWQLASLANILNRPVVSVCPTFGTLHTRHDMHRVFFPFNEPIKEQTPVFIMWSSLNGKTVEKDFVLNHFTALIPYEAAHTDYESDTSLSNSLSEILDELFMADEKDPGGTEEVVHVDEFQSSYEMEPPKSDGTTTHPDDTWSPSLDETTTNPDDTTSERPFNDESVLEAPSGHVDDGDAYTPLEVDTNQQIQDATDKMINEPPATSDTTSQRPFNDDSMLEAPSGHVDDGDAYTPLEVDTNQKIKDATDRMLNEPPATSDTTSERPFNDDSMLDAPSGLVDDGDAYTPLEVDTNQQFQDATDKMMNEPPETSDTTSERPFNDDSVLEAPSEHVDDGDAYTPLEVDTSQQIEDATDKMMAEPPATSNTNVNTITSTRYHTGDYIIIQHGSTLLPAVVGVWPWVRFFRRKKKTWTLNETAHTIEATDVRANSVPPEIILCGRSRLLYKFTDVLLQ